MPTFYLIGALSGVVVMFVGIGLLLYFRKRDMQGGANNRRGRR